MLGQNTLLVKHLPAELSPGDREELLKLVGAIKVRVMPDSGKMKYTAFATFQNYEEAKQALSILHQREILNRKLVVEFSKEQHGGFIPHISDHSKLQNIPSKEASTKSSEKEVLRLDMEEFSRKLHGVAPTLGLDYLPSPLLKYKYPPPTPTIIQNISNALASVPKFYTQVLHLMNKMNLPAPFGPLTPAPPLAPDQPIEQENEQRISFGGDSLEVENMEVTSSEEESEYESENEEGQTKLEKIYPENPLLKPKRKKKVKLTGVSLPLTASKRRKTEPSEVFDSQPLNQKKISMKKIDQIVPVATTQPVASTGGFGEIEPSKIVDEDEITKREPLEESWNDTNFITKEELRKKRLSSREMKTLSIFRNFSPGEPSCRLYIKNLAKQVEEKDLRYIFGRFIDKNSDIDKNMFDIKLMKEGRMKGQAFVSLANENQAKEAVREINGFVLHTKPLVVQFARSAKPKEDKKGTKP